MEFKVNCGIWGSMFGVPDVVADNFLKLATGQQLKVLLYLLRSSGRVCSDEEIAMNTGVSLQEAADAVLFWQQANVLTQQNVSAPANNTIMNAVPQVQPLQMQPPKVSQPVQPQQTESDTARTATKFRQLSPSEIADIMRNSTDISELFKVAETILGPLSYAYQNSLIRMYDYLGMKVEVIVVLITYCKNIEKTNPSYIEKIAADWAENEINDLNAAQTEVQRISLFRDFTGQIMRIFEMNRRPTGKQSEFIEQWRTTGFDIELIRYAYEKTIEKIDKLNFDYINKILVSWHECGYKTVQDVRDAENDYYSKKKNSQKTSDDSDIDKYNFVFNKF